MPEIYLHDEAARLVQIIVLGEEPVEAQTKRQVVRRGPNWPRYYYPLAAPAIPSASRHLIRGHGEQGQAWQQCSPLRESRPAAPREARGTGDTRSPTSSRSSPISSTQASQPPTVRQSSRSPEPLRQPRRRQAGESGPIHRTWRRLSSMMRFTTATPSSPGPAGRDGTSATRRSSVAAEDLTTTPTLPSPRLPPSPPTARPSSLTPGSLLMPPRPELRRARRASAPVLAAARAAPFHPPHPQSTLSPQH